MFEIHHRKRRNRVEHFFARLNHFNFKFEACGLPTDAIGTAFNFLMHVLSRAMLWETVSTNKWNYDHLVELRPDSDLKTLARCKCQMNDVNRVTQMTRDCLVWRLAIKYGGTNLKTENPPNQLKARRNDTHQQQEMNFTINMSNPPVITAPKALPSLEDPKPPANVPVKVKLKMIPVATQGSTAK